MSRLFSSFEKTNHSDGNQSCGSLIGFLAFVHFQMSHGAPAPEEEKKVEVAPSAPAASSAAPSPVEATETAAAEVSFICSSLFLKT